MVDFRLPIWLAPNARNKVSIRSLLDEGSTPSTSTMDLVTLRRLYPNTPNAEIGRIIGESKSNVGKMASILGLKKDSRYLSDVNRRNGEKGLFVMYGKR